MIWAKNKRKGDTERQKEIWLLPIPRADPAYGRQLKKKEKVLHKKISSYLNESMSSSWTFFQFVWKDQMSVPTGFGNDHVPTNYGGEQLMDGSWGINYFDSVSFFSIFQAQYEIAIVQVLFAFCICAFIEPCTFGGSGTRPGSWIGSTHNIFQLIVWYSKYLCVGSLR